MSFIGISSKEDQFYPTPKTLIDKMLQGIKWGYVKNVLEPSAGKGDIIVECLKHNIYRHLSIDAIEKNTLFHQAIQDNIQKYYKENEPYEKHTIVPIIHDDFLTFDPIKDYDLIVMNPPFNHGDLHLLKALDIAKNGGSIICILNAETIKNPYSNSRKELVNLLERYNAQIEYLQDEFVNAERKTSVEVALIKVHIQPKEQPSFYYEKFKKAEKFTEEVADDSELEVTDWIKMIVNRYKVEVKTYRAFMEEYHSLKKVALDGIPFTLVDAHCRSYTDATLNEILQSVRLNYWRKLLESPKVMGKLPSEVMEQYRRKVTSMKDYDITEYNIKNLITEINAVTKSSLEEQIVKTFDELTNEHSYFKENCKNIHYYNGWKTNKAHKIDKKVIIPCYKTFDNDWGKEWQPQNVINKIEDIEKVLNFLDGNMTQEVDLKQVVTDNLKNNVTKNIQLKYFKMTVYKKGTLHLTFTCPKLIERFNIYVGKSRNWLPPSYGVKSYKDMDKAEQEVVNSFQGEKAYEEVMKKKDFYIASPIRTQSLLEVHSN